MLLAVRHSGNLYDLLSHISCLDKIIHYLHQNRLPWKLMPKPSCNRRISIEERSKNNEHFQDIAYFSRVLRKLGIMLVRKLSSQISLCSPHRLIRDDNFRFYGIFRLNDVSS